MNHVFNIQPIIHTLQASQHEAAKTISTYVIGQRFNSSQFDWPHTRSAIVLQSVYGNSKPFVAIDGLKISWTDGKVFAEIIFGQSVLHIYYYVLSQTRRQSSSQPSIHKMELDVQSKSFFVFALLTFAIHHPI